MPLCGFNEKMLEGLLAFNEGLVEHGILKRSQAKSRSFEQTLRMELSDMDRFLAETSAIKDPRLRKIVEGLTTYAQGFYEIVSEADIHQYKVVAKRLQAYFANMDATYYSELEGKTEDMKSLVAHLNKQSI